MCRLLPGVLIAIAIALPTFARAEDDVARAKASALLHLHKMQAADTDVEIARAKATAILTLMKITKDPHELAEHECTSDLAIAQAIAKKRGKPLFLWVGMTCVDNPTVRKAFDAVHCHMDECNGSAKPRLLIQAPDGQFYPIPKDDISPAKVREILVPFVPATVTPKLVPMSAMPVQSFRGSNC